MNKKITLSDGTTWDAKVMPGLPAPQIFNVDDPAADMSSAQWNEYATTFCKNNADAVRAAGAKLAGLRVKANHEAFERDLAARRAAKS